MVHSFVFFILIAAAQYHAGCGITTFHRDLVQVKPGLDICVTNNCSPSSNALVDCVVHECDKLATTDKTSQGVDVEAAYVEKYYSVADESEKLALHVEWSPIDNVSSDYLKGFKIDISDGSTQYSICYQVNTTLAWSSIKHDIFYNDCFGKMVGTVIPGSNITVSITPLPLNGITGSQKTSVIIEVPYCSNEDLHSLPDCFVLGGRPTSRPCIDNCTTYSVVGFEKHNVHCSITDQSILLNNPMLRSCRNDRVDVSGTPSSPTKVPSNQDWYKYIDPISKEVKIALNFTWRPGTDSSIEDLTGYEVTVVGPGSLAYTKCFAIHTSLTEAKHKEVIFFYDCYGRKADHPVDPGRNYTVSISSIPKNTQRPRPPLSIKIPTCANPEVQDVQECIKNTNRRMTVKVEQIYCSNRTLRVSYFATEEYGESFRIALCESGTLQRTGCKVQLQYVTRTERSGTIYDFSLPSSANLSIGYNLYIHAHGIDERNYDYPDFTVCIQAVSDTVIGFIVAICGIVVALIAFGIWYCCFRHKCGFWIFKKAKRPRPEYHVSARHPPSDSDDIPLTLPGRAKVYVVFADDHELHRNVIHWFCSFLQRDLGLAIKVHIWELNTTAFSRPQYVLNNLQDSDKVVVICSEGSNSALENKDVGNMYAPVVRQLCADSLAARNPEKYVIGYFSYTKGESIPDMLRSHIKMYSPAFKLMEQLEQFYFRLIGTEQYQDQGILKINEIDQFFEPERRSESALKLLHAIAKMTELTRINPTWYQDLHGHEENKEILPEPISKMPAALHQYESIMDFQGGESSIAHLIAASPPHLRNGKMEHNGGPAVMDTTQNGTSSSARQISSQHPAQNYDNQNQTVTRSPPKQNGGSVGYHVQNEAVRWTSPTRQPAEHGSREPCEHDAALTSFDASFEISESEDLSSVAPSKQTSKLAQKQASNTAEFELSKTPDVILDTNVSYHPDSFNTGDFAAVNEIENGYDSQVLTFLPSTSTQATDVDELSLQHQSEEVDRLMNKAMVRKPSSSNAPESGLFTLAVIDEEDDLDLEDQIKSINLSANF